MRRFPPRLARPLAAALLATGALFALPVAATATEHPEGPGELRRRIEALDATIAGIHRRIDGRVEATAHGSWLLFKARRALDVARLEMRDARIWEVAPDAMRLSLLGPTAEEYAVRRASERLRTLMRAPRVGGLAEADETLRRRLTGLEVLRAELAGQLEQVGGAARPSWGPGTPDAGEWARAFLHEIGAPACKENLMLVVAWQAQEGTEARFNPLATTRSMPGATDFNSVGVKNYRSVAQGLTASRATLEQDVPSYGYAPILASLRACNDAEATAWFVNASAWCRGCTGGAYLTGLLPAVRADYAVYAAR